MGLRVALVLLLSVLGGPTVFGQFNDQGLNSNLSIGRQDLRGQIVSDSGVIFSDLYAEIYEIGAAGSLIDRSSVSGNGEFTLSGVPAGPCNLRITDGSGAVLSEQLVEVGASFGRAIGSTARAFRETGSLRSAASLPVPAICALRMALAPSSANNSSRWVRRLDVSRCVWPEARYNARFRASFR